MVHRSTRVVHNALMHYQPAQSRLLGELDVDEEPLEETGLVILRNSVRLHVSGINLMILCCCIIGRRPLLASSSLADNGCSDPGQAAETEHSQISHGLI